MPDCRADLGRDLREAVYDKSLAFSASDFETFGTASMITRTLNDVNIIQQAFVYFIQMILPVPMVCVLGIALAFRINTQMGVLILCGTCFVLLAALLIMGKAAPIFEKLQRFLDRMNVVLRENITGVRVIRAFNKERHETRRMNATFDQYATSSIRQNCLVCRAGLPCKCGDQSSDRGSGLPWRQRCGSRENADWRQHLCDRITPFGSCSMS